MTLRNLPTPLNPIATLSPSGLGPVLTGSGCKLRLLLDARSNGIRYLPPSGAGPWGNVIHNVMELARTNDGDRYRRVAGVPTPDPTWNWRSAGDEFDSEVADQDTECQGDDLTDHLQPMNLNRDGFWIDRQKLMKRADRERAAFLAGRGGGGGGGPRALLGAEVRVQDADPDPKIYGMIDKVENDPAGGGGVRIVDYKTGAIVDDTGNPLDKHVIQLQLYAGLWEIHTTRNGLPRAGYPTAASLESPLSGDPDVPVILDQARSLRLINNARAEYDTIEANRAAAVANPSDIFQLATPSDENCRHCSARPACQSYISRLESKMESGEEKIFDVVGELVRVDRENSSPKCKVIIRDSGTDPAQWAVHGICWQQSRNRQEIDDMIASGAGSRVGVFGCTHRSSSEGLHNFQANLNEHRAMIRP